MKKANGGNSPKKQQFKGIMINTDSPIKKNKGRESLGWNGFK